MHSCNVSRCKIKKLAMKIYLSSSFRSKNENNNEEIIMLLIQNSNFSIKLLRIYDIEKMQYLIGFVVIVEEQSVYFPEIWQPAMFH